MDAAGNILLTMRHKVLLFNLLFRIPCILSPIFSYVHWFCFWVSQRLSFNQRWDAFTGDGHGCGKAAFSVTKSAFTLFSNKPSARVVLNPIKGHNTKLCDYQMKGSLYKPSSSFTVLGGSGEIVAQVCCPVIEYDFIDVIIKAKRVSLVGILIDSFIEYRRQHGNKRRRRSC